MAGILAYTLWGILGIFWKLLEKLSPFDILAYRFLFSSAYMLLYIDLTGNVSEFLGSLKKIYDQKQLKWLILASILIAINWGMYIYMVSNKQATEASLGYYLLPILNIVVAVTIFKEKMTRYTLISTILVFLGVIIMTVSLHSIPLNMFILIMSFCLYGIVKRKISISPIFSIAIENLIILPIAVIYLYMYSSLSFFSYSSNLKLLIMMSGLVTIIPLFLFSISIKKINFITLGFIQYINPTLQLGIAIVIFHEPLTQIHVIVFFLIWLGILIYIAEIIVTNKTKYHS
ncbi:EamA family transporter RarD [Enterococcus sp. DIV2381]|uniref:EamA family transporter RarD n=1 Tax=unclassified Enterococcus TaxID=2608891 RepID=UPI003D2665A5